MKAFSLYFVFLDEMEAMIRMRMSKRRWSGVEKGDGSKITLFPPCLGNQA